MSDPSSAQLAIQNFAELAIARRQGNLPLDKRTEMDALEEIIREQIDGARPAPKRISNPSAASASRPNRPGSFADSGPSQPSQPSQASQAPQPTQPSTPAKTSRSSTKAGTVSISDLADSMSMSRSDQKKITEITADLLPPSAYTPPTYASFMADYYSDTVVPAQMSTSDIPSSVVNAEGDKIALDKETKILLGLEKPEPRAPSVPPQPGQPGRAPAPRAPSVAQAGMPAIVHFVSGGAKRGVVEQFDPDSGQVALLPKKLGAAAESITLEGVLAIFFGLERGKQPTTGQGRRLSITLVNDRRVSGLSEDYQEGGNSLTLVPDPRRGNIDRIWVPASAVKEIQLL